MVGAFVGIQFVPAKRTNPPANPKLTAPPRVTETLRRACYDCHSNATRWPWYSRVAPFSWFLVHDVSLGRKEVNFSEWDNYYPVTRRHKLEWMRRALRQEEMPPWPYWLIHPAARLTEADRAELDAGSNPSWPAGRPEISGVKGTNVENAVRATFILVLLLPLLRVARAEAQLDPWEFEVYPYSTVSRGIIELETDNAVVANGHSHGENGTAAGTFRSQGMWYNGNELTYGVSDRIEAAGYLDMAQPSGRGFWWAGDKFRLRGRLFDQEALPVDLGWYLEVEYHKMPQFDDASWELELKPIIEKDFGPISLVANPVFEKVLSGAGRNQGFEFGYRNGVYYRWMRYLSPGVEFYGGIGLIDDNDPISEQQHYIFPVIWGELPHGIEYNVGSGFGLTPGSDHVIIKFNLEIEKFLGAIFGPSSERSWFF